MPRLILLPLLALSAFGAVRVEDLRCEYRTNPLGIDVTAPRLSWRLVGSDIGAKGIRQTAYRVIAASTEAGLQAASADLWDSGKVATDQSVHIIYNGKKLTSGIKVFWKAQIWDQDGTASEWSAPSAWSMGLLSPADWSGKWIGKDEAAVLRRPDSAYHRLTAASWIWTPDAAEGRHSFERTFEITPGHSVRRASFILGAESSFTLTVNGKPAGKGSSVSMPEVLEVATLLKPGKNLLRVDAEYTKGGFGPQTPKRPGMIGVLRVEFDKGEPLTVITDASWSSKEGVKLLGPYGSKPWGEVGFSEERWLPARTLRKEFDASKPIRRATAHMSGLGLSELYVNGVKAGTDVLSPGLTEYGKRSLYVTYDVTTMLRSGRNALGVLLGNGRYFAPRLIIPIASKTYGYPKLLLQLEIEYADGTRARVVSDETWRVSTDGPVRGNNEYDGEDYDARREMPGWSTAGYKDATWSPAVVVAAPGGALSAQMAEPIAVTQTIKPSRVTRLRQNVYIFDMGQNMVGWCRLRVAGSRGNVVRLRHAETLAADGSLYLANLRSARAEDNYTLKGGVVEIWEPRFTYHGFRYIEVTGYPGAPNLESLEGRVVHDSMESAGSFESSNELLNQIHHNMFWGVRGNYRSIPTDCPQRDERQGWMGDRSQVSVGETFLFDVAAFYSKWMTDIADAQGPDGAISDVNPSYWSLYTGDVTWPSTFILLPGTLYEQYGDKRVIARDFDAMKKWMLLMRGFMKDGVLAKDTFGDWCVPPESPELIHSKDPARQTDKTLLATAYFYLLAQKMSEYAKLIDRPADVEEFDSLASELRTGFERKFYNSARGLYDNGTQTSSLLPLAFGITKTSERTRVLNALVSRIHSESNDHIGTGLVGAQWLMRVLSDNGQADLALKIATQKTYPGWGYMVERGATTVWELWNGDTADPAMNSGNHVMQIGDLTIWMYEYLGGIRPDPANPGYKHFVIKPVAPAGLDSVAVTRKTMYGEIRSSWKREGNGLSIKVTVPPNTTATLYIPGEAQPRELVSGSHEWATVRVK